MTGIESILFWATTVLLAAVFFITILSIVFKKPSLNTGARWMLLFAFIILTVFGVIRWNLTGHPPFVTLFESMITSIWFILLITLILFFKLEKMAVLSLPVSLVTFLMMGWASSMPKDATPLSVALTNVWLFIHASFATAGAAAFLVGASLSLLYLLGEEKLNRFQKSYKKIPEFKQIPKTIINFLIFGLILWGVMIVSGSIWAHVAWGRYWAWDPIELWSLIGWILFGLVIHARLTLKISHNLFCWLTIIAALTVVFALWGVGYLYETIHVYG